LAEVKMPKGKITGQAVSRVTALQEIEAVPIREPDVAAALALQTSQRWEVQHFTESLPGDKGSLPIDIFRPNTRSQSPAVLFLYGALGLTQNYLPFLQYLVQQGFVMVVPHYFNPTGTVCARGSTSRTHFLPWLGSLIDVLGVMRTYPQIDSARIGVLGVSLGASLALSLGAQVPGLKAVVEFFGYIPRIALVSSMPPTMIVHGGWDKHVPVRSAITLALALKEKNIPCEMKIYPWERHVIRPLAFADAVKRAKDFLVEYL
jgi:carboxymethylenebutenolidase